MEAEGTGTSLALIGEYGSGKSTIRSLVQSALAAEAGMRVVSLSLWPYADEQAAARGIVHCLIEAIGQHTSTLPLVGVSGSYVEAISGAGGLGERVAKLLQGSEAPEDILRRINATAAALGVHMVLWVEDLERFAQSHGPHSAGRDSQQLGPLRAMLHLIDKQAWLSVVLATTTFDAQFDLPKIARFTEVVPFPSPSFLRPVLENFRDGCLSMSNWVDSAGHDARMALAFSSEHFDALTFALLHQQARGRESIPPPSLAVLQLVTTPRILKQALRRCLDSWESPLGELDFDDALVLSVLQVAHPDVIDSLYRNQAKLRDGQGDGAWADYGRKNATQLEAIRALVRFLAQHPNLRARPQGVAFDRPDNYFYRFIASPDLQDHARDQPVLRAIQRFDVDAIVDMMDDPTRVARVMAFADRQSGRRRARLLARSLGKHGGKRIDWYRERPLSIPNALRLLRVEESEGEGGRLVSTVRRLLPPLVRCNLGAAEYLLRVAVLGPRGEPSLGDAPAATLHSALARAFTRRFLERPDELASELATHGPQMLARCCWGSLRIERNAFDGMPFEGWEEFADTAAGAATRLPDVMLPQLSYLATDNWRRRGITQGLVIFNEQLFQSLFGDRAERLLELFRSNPRIEIGDDDARQRYELIRRSTGGVGTNDYCKGAANLSTPVAWRRARPSLLDGPLMS